MRKQKGRRRRPRKDPRTKPVWVSTSNGRALAETPAGVTIGRWDYRTNTGTIKGRAFNDLGDWFANVKRMGEAIA